MSEFTRSSAAGANTYATCFKPVSDDAQNLDQLPMDDFLFTDGLLDLGGLPLSDEQRDQVGVLSALLLHPKNCA